MGKSQREDYDSSERINSVKGSLEDLRIRRIVADLGKCLQDAEQLNVQHLLFVSESGMMLSLVG